MNFFKFDTKVKGWGPIWHSRKVMDQFDTKVKGWRPKQYLNLQKIIIKILGLRRGYKP